MQLGLINSAFAQAGKDTAYGLEQIKRIGFDSVDIFTDPLDIDEAERRLIAHTCERVDLPIKSVCCVALGLIDFNPFVQRFHVDRCKAFLDLTRECGADNLLLVIGGYMWQQEVTPPPRISGQSVSGTSLNWDGMPATWGWRLCWSWSLSDCLSSTRWTPWCAFSTTSINRM